MRTDRKHTVRLWNPARLVFSVVALAALTTTGGAARVPGPSAANVAPRSHPRAALAQLPIRFEANRGQTDPLVRFLSRAPGYTLFLTPTEAVLALDTGAAPAAAGARGAGAYLPDSRPSQVALRMTLVGANPASDIQGLDELAGTINYARIPAGSGRPETVPSYARVAYRAIYPGIDLLYYGNGRSLEYDFVVAPGSSPDTIRLSIAGADALRVEASGELAISTRAGELRMKKPVVYQEHGGRRRAVAGRYVIDGDAIGFRIGAYDRQRPLVIDPVLLYSSFLGGSDAETGTDVTLDAAGNIYVTGYTASLNFPLMNPSQPGKAASWDAFVAKLNPAGTALVYATYFGGDGADVGLGITVDAGGNAYVAGAFGIAGSFGLFDQDVLVAKFSSTGINLYAVTFGSADDDTGFAVAVDAGGYAYVTGKTGAASDFPTTATAFQPDWAGFNDAFLSVLNPTATTLVYSTYLGGGFGDEGRAIALDAAGDVYVTGGTMGAIPTTVGAFQRDLRGFGDAFVAKLKPYLSGSASVAYLTLLGGVGFEVGHSIAVDSTGSAYVTGTTDSSLDFPISAGAFQTVGGGGNCGTFDRPRDCQDAFVTKLNAAGSALVYSTYLGGLGHDFANGIALDSARNAYVVGQAFAADFPLHNPIQPAKGSLCCTDAFVTKFSASGAVVYSTYVGGAADDSASDVAVDGSGAAYVIGSTSSSNFPLVGPFQGTYRGTGDAFLLKIGDSACSFSISPSSQSFAAAAGSGSISVTASASTCAWTATSAAPWVSITSGSGTGSGTAMYAVAANTTTAPRTGTLTVGGQIFTVTQAAAAACTYSISPASQSFGESAGTGTVAVTASASTCAWTATTPVSWISITSGGGTGSGAATYAVAANTTTAARTATLTVAGLPFAVNQTAPSSALSVTLAAPNGGEKLYTGTPYRLEWTAAGAIARFDLEVSTNGGASYAAVPGCSALAGSSRSCTWASPGPVSTAALIRVLARDAGGASVSDASNAAFSIVSGTGAITVTFPNSGVNVGIGSLQQVEWKHNLGTAAFVRIELSRDGGLTYPELLAAAVPNTAATTGTFAWRVSGPATVGAQAKLRVSWTHGTTSDVSNVAFTVAPVFVKLTAPKTNSSWGFDTRQKQVWTTNLGALDLVHVQLSTAGAAGPFTTLAGGAHIVATKKMATVTVPTAPTTAARIKGVWANPPAGAVLETLNPGNFRIEAPFINLTAPTPGQVWTVGTLSNIAWTNNLGALESVEIELSKDGGATYPVIVLPSTPSDGAQKVTVQGAWGSQSTTRIRVSWVKSPAVLAQSANFTIQP